MDTNLNSIFEEVEQNKQKILDAERWLWHHPELSYREWETHAYLKAQYEALGYQVHEAGDIPGFYVDIDTGKPGPKIGVFGEMDAIRVDDHPEANPETGAVHACGHHAQSAALYGIAIALKAKGALDGLCGSIRLIAVPAEEGIDAEFKKEIMGKGIIRYIGGKQEFLRRGILDGVDISFMMHGGEHPFGMNLGCNGSIYKKFTFRGKAAHAAGAWAGNNALYAATSAINTINALRETFYDLGRVRCSAILTSGGELVNVVPSEVSGIAQVRALKMDLLNRTNEKINRALAASAAGMNCRVEIEDELMYAPRQEDMNLQKIFLETAQTMWSEEEIHINNPPAPGCTDMGDVSMVMPVVHAHIGGGKGAGHSATYEMADPTLACVKNAKFQTAVLVNLLRNDAEKAKYVLEHKKVQYASVAEYLEAVEHIRFKTETVFYNDDGTVTLRFKK